LEDSISKFRKSLLERSRVRLTAVDFQGITNDYKLNVVKSKKAMDNFVAAKKREIENSYL